MFVFTIIMTNSCIQRVTERTPCQPVHRTTTILSGIIIPNSGIFTKSGKSFGKWVSVSFTQRLEQHRRQRRLMPAANTVTMSLPLHMPMRSMYMSMCMRVSVLVLVRMRRRG